MIFWILRIVDGHAFAFDIDQSANMNLSFIWGHYRDLVDNWSTEEGLTRARPKTSAINIEFNLALNYYYLQLLNWSTSRLLYSLLLHHGVETQQGRKSSPVVAILAFQFGLYYVLVALSCLCSNQPCFIVISIFGWSDLFTDPTYTSGIFVCGPLHHFIKKKLPSVTCTGGGKGRVPITHHAEFFY